MSKQPHKTPDKPRKIGRPATGQGKLIGCRVHPDMLERVETWRRKNAPDLATGSALRQLAEIGLKASA